MTSDMQHQAPAGHRPLARSAQPRQLAGVAAGIGRHFDMSPALVRVGFVVLAFMGGFGVLLYILCWLLIPEEGQRRSMAEQAFDDDDNSNSTLAFVLAGVAAIIVLTSLNLFNGGMILAAGLFAAGLLLYRFGGQSGGRPADDGSSSSPVATDTGSETAASVSPGAYLEAAHAEIAEIADPPLHDYDPVYSFSDDVPQPQSEPVRRPSYLGRLTLAFSLVVVGVLAFLDTVGVIDAGLSDYLAAILAVIGLGLMIGTVVGRARWLILPGLLLVPTLLVASLVSVPLGSSYGEFDFRPTTHEQLDASYEFGGADVRFDLRDLAPLTNDLTVSVDIGGGQLEVIVPPGLDFVLDADVAAGEIDIDTGRASPSSITGSQDRAGVLVEQRFERIESSGPVLEFVVDVAFGSVQLVLAEG